VGNVATVGMEQKAGGEMGAIELDAPGHDGKVFVRMDEIVALRIGMYGTVIVLKNGVSLRVKNNERLKPVRADFRT